MRISPMSNGDCSDSPKSYLHSRLHGLAVMTSRTIAHMFFLLGVRWTPALGEYGLLGEALAFGVAGDGVAAPFRATRFLSRLFGNAECALAVEKRVEKGLVWSGAVEIQVVVVVYMRGRRWTDGAVPVRLHVDVLQPRLALPVRLVYAASLVRVLSLLR